MIAHLQRLFAYDAWANHEVLDALRSAGQPPATALKRLAHVLSAERLWLERLTGQKQTLPVWPDFSLPQLESHANETARLWKDYLDRLTESELDRTCHYTNSKGEHWSSRTEDILIHVVMHSAYHRGQIASDIRAAGFDPAYTDFIHAIRQEFMA